MYILKHFIWVEKNKNIFIESFLQVFVGGASEGLLQPGDKLLSINSQDVGLMSHFEAQHLFR